MRRLLDLLRLPQRVSALEDQNRFLLSELAKLLAAQRRSAVPDLALDSADQRQTCESFHYQWKSIPDGIGTGRDTAFMDQVRVHLLRMTDLSESWFPGKQVADVGCGGGRFSHGLLQLGAHVTAIDQSSHALSSTLDLCRNFQSRLTTMNTNLLEWTAHESYDLVFCFGVVHHTGNTYRAIHNLSRSLRAGGRLFLMAYGFPETPEDCAELNAYEHLRNELAAYSLEERRKAILERFETRVAHGMFDAVSPRLNDLLTYSELSTLLHTLGLQGVKRTVQNRNLHVIADRPLSSETGR